MIKKEGIAIAGGYGLMDLLDMFGKEGGAIAPEQLTTLLQTIDIKTMFVLAAILWYFRSEKKEKPLELTDVICPFAPIEREL